MLRFFKKEIPLEQLEQLLLQGAGIEHRGVLYALRKQFDLIGQVGDILYKKLKRINQEELAFDHALQRLTQTISASSKTAIRSFEYLWDQELIHILESGNEILMQWITKYLVHRFYKIRNEDRYRKFYFDETVRRSIFNDALDQFIRRIKSKKFQGKSTLRTFFSTILYNEFVNETRKLDTNKRSGDKYTFWDDNDGFVDDLIYSKGLIQDGLSKIDYDHLMKILDIFEQQNKDCFDLITASYLDDIPLPVLAERQGKTRNNLTVKRFNCFNALRTFWKNNQNI